MKVDISKIANLKRKIKVEVSGKDFLTKKEELYKEFAKKLKVPGFRPGAAPSEVIEKHHGKFLKEEFLQKALPEFYTQALTEAKLFPVS